LLEKCGVGKNDLPILKSFVSSGCTWLHIIELMYIYSKVSNLPYNFASIQMY
jgi:hypothetical protein